MCVCVCVCERACARLTSHYSSPFVPAGSLALSSTEQENPTLVRRLGTIFLPFHLPPSLPPSFSREGWVLALGTRESPFEYSALYSRHKKMAPNSTPHGCLVLELEPEPIPAIGSWEPWELGPLGRGRRGQRTLTPAVLWVQTSCSRNRHSP